MPKSDSNNFIHLRVHSDKSLIDSTLKTKDVVDVASSHSYNSAVITDICNVYGFINFYKYARENKIKPIAAAELLILNKNNSFVLPLLAKNQQGYRNLLKLISIAYANLSQTANKGLIKHLNLPKLTSSQVFEYSEGLIALSGGLGGELSSLLLRGNVKVQQEYITSYKNAFVNAFYIEVHRVGLDEEEKYNQKAIAIAEQYSIPLVATNLVCFEKAKDYEVHNIRYCINAKLKLEDSSLKMLYTKQQHFKSGKAMAELFKDIPQAVANTELIAKKCNLEIELDNHVLPEYDAMDGMTVEAELHQRSQQGLAKRLKLKFAGKLTKEITENYKQRLEKELTVITEMNFASYYLIVWQLTQYAIDNNISMGPGRGSGVGSLVAYCLRITNIDPIEYGLLFERFLNSGRKSMPDFDLDYSPDRREEIINQVANLYGSENVAQIVTFQKLGAKGVVRDVARVLGKSNALANSIANLIENPQDKLGDLLGKTKNDIASDDFNADADDYANDYDAIGSTTNTEKTSKVNTELIHKVRVDLDAKQICDYAMRLEGISRNIGTHAAGIVISPKDFSYYSALTITEDGDAVVQYDKSAIESAGLVKFDLLGLSTLIMLDHAQELIKKVNKNFTINDLNFTDQKTYDLIATGDTLGLFQIESDGMTKCVLQIPPTNLEEISIVLALYRPGPMESGMLENYTKRANNEQKIYYPEPDINVEIFKDILQSTKGVVAYQEQVMQIATIFSSFSLNEADDLRRAMGKKSDDMMQELKTKFIDGAVKNNHDPKLATRLFERIEVFAGYGFNKSHSIAYAAICYYTAYLKAHYPRQFMVSYLALNYASPFKINNGRHNCIDLNLQVLEPDINYSDFNFSESTRQENGIEYALIATKGVGDIFSQYVVKERKDNAVYTGIEDFCSRVVNKQSNASLANITKLIKAGFFDGVYKKYAKRLVRKVLLDNIQSIYESSLRANVSSSKGISDLFAQEQRQSVLDLKTYSIDEAMSEEKMLFFEWESIGYFFSGNPLDSYKKEFANIETLKVEHIREKNARQNKENNILCGWLTDIRLLNYQANVKNNLEDKTKLICTAYFGLQNLQFNISESIYQKRADEFKINTPIVITINKAYAFQNKETKDIDYRVKVVDCLSLFSYRISNLKAVSIQITGLRKTMVKNLIKHLNDNIKIDGKAIYLEYSSDDLSATFSFNNKVDLNLGLIDNIRSTISPERINWQYTS